MNVSRAPAISTAKALLLTCLFSFSGAVSAAPAVDEDCRKFLDALSAEYSYGWVNVPEDWANPHTSPKIDVFYVHRSIPEGQTPVAYFNGGPFGTGHSFVLKGQSYNILWDNVPLVLIDQRGTGCSTRPLPTPKQANLSLYGSRSIVKDAEVIRKQLFGSRKWKIFGQSYGGLTALRYVTLAPEGLVAAHIFGHSHMDDGVEWSLARLVAQGTVAAEYFKKYPQDIESLKFLKGLLSLDVCVENTVGRICGPEILDAFSNYIGFPEVWEEMHGMIQQLIPRIPGRIDPEALKEMAEKAGALPRNRLKTIVGYVVISKLEQMPGYDDLAACRESVRRLRARGFDADALPVSECRYTEALFRDNEWLAAARSEIPVTPDPILNQEVKAALQAHPALHFYVYAAELDPYDPVETYHEMVSVLGERMKFFLRPGDHGGFFKDSLVLRELLLETKGNGK